MVRKVYFDNALTRYLYNIISEEWDFLLMKNSCALAVFMSSLAYFITFCLSSLKRCACLGKHSARESLCGLCVEYIILFLRSAIVWEGWWGEELWHPIFPSTTALLAFFYLFLSTLQVSRWYLWKRTSSTFWGTNEVVTLS